MADGVNRLLNIDALKGFKHFRSFFRQTEPDASYFIFSGRSIACFDSGSEHFQLETVSERSLEQMVPVLEKLGKNNSSRQWFFLWEPPWVLTFYERVIVLNREEIRAFALGRFLEGPKNSLEDEIETWDLEGPPVDESPHWVGAAYLEKNLHSTLGLLTAILDPKAQEFHARCEKTFRRKIEHVPLIYPLLSKVERPPQEAMLFYSFDQCYHLQWEDERLVELSHVPKLEKTARENLIQDLFPEPMAVARLSHPRAESETGDHSQPSDTESRSMADLVSGFHGTVNDPQKGFAWIPPSRKGFPRIWMVLIPLILSMTGFLYYWVERTDRHLESIHEERIKLQQQLEDQRKRVQESRAIQDQRAEMELAREQYAFQQQHRYQLLEALEQIFYSVEGAWIEQIRYHQNSISLNLFSEDPEVIPELLKRFSQSGKFEQVRLQSRSKIQIKGREVVRISLKMNIAPGKAKRNKNNE